MASTVYGLAPSSASTTRPLEARGLKVGSDVVGLVKSTEVSIAKL